MSRIINPCEFIENNAKKYPNRFAALQDTGEGITYSEMLDIVTVAGNAIFQKNGGIRKPVIVLCNRSIWSYIALMAVAWAGDFYCPIDDKIPDKRLNKISDILGNPLVIKGKKEDIEALIAFGKEINLRVSPWKQLINHDLLYVMFTSGSTGTPKGVCVRISAVLEMTEAFTETINFPNPLVLGNQAPFDFDVSTKDIYLSLYHAGTIIIIPGKYFAMPGNLINLLNQNRVNTLIWAVSAIRIIENYHCLDAEIPEHLALVMFSGETMFPRIMRYWQSKLPSCIFVNLYGPTEVTGNCTYYIIDREFHDDEKIPIGKSFFNFDVMLEDEAGNLITEEGLEGEICVRGERVAAGYYNNDIQTENAFRQTSYQNYFVDKEYHTGDIGKYDKNGDIIFCGRRDNQIKYMGHRIELDEIEATGEMIPEIDICCAVFDNENNRIVLFYESKNDLLKQLDMQMKDLLPKYMLPSEYIRMEKMPQTSHGKCDRIKLKELLKEKMHE